MDLRYSEDERAFRAEVRRKLDAAIPDHIRRKMIDGRSIAREELVEWTRILDSLGWAVPHWPREWGGTGWDSTQLCIYRNELQATPAPEPLSFGVNYVGPVLYTFGSEAQRNRFLPRIRRLEDWWCQGFSEPGSGSDLASLRTSARRVGDHWVLSGQKTWTTLAQHADWMFCLARTDPEARKQKGISFFLVDMKAPGVSVRPIQLIDGGREVNEVFFDDVKLPPDSLVGEENRGWDYAKFLLGNERTGVARVGVSRARLRRIREIAAAERAGDRPIAEDPHFRERLAEIEVELKALEILQLRVIANEKRLPRGTPDPTSSILKLKGSEIQQATSELLMQVAGPWAIPWEQESVGEATLSPPDDLGAFETTAPLYFNWRKVSIYGGTNEVQRNIVAKAILGL